MAAYIEVVTQEWVPLIEYTSVAFRAEPSPTDDQLITGLRNAVPAAARHPESTTVSSVGSVLSTLLITSTLLAR